jgi:hypothetical protein
MADTNTSFMGKLHNATDFLGVRAAVGDTMFHVGLLAMSVLIILLLLHYTTEGFDIQFVSKNDHLSKTHTSQMNGGEKLDSGLMVYERGRSKVEGMVGERNHPNGNFWDTAGGAKYTMGMGPDLLPKTLNDEMLHPAKNKDRTWYKQPTGGDNRIERSMSDDIDPRGGGAEGYEGAAEEWDRVKYHELLEGTKLDPGNFSALEGFGNNRAAEDWNEVDYPMITTNNSDLTGIFPQGAPSHKIPDVMLDKLWG